MAAAAAAAAACGLDGECGLLLDLDNLSLGGAAGLGTPDKAEQRALAPREKPQGRPTPVLQGRVIAQMQEQLQVVEPRR